MNKTIIIAALLFFVAQLCNAQALISAGLDSKPSAGLMARIEVNTTQELHSLLRRAEKLLDNGEFVSGDTTPIAFVLHGAEAKAFVSANYKDNKALVDLAARLSAFKVVDVRVCRTWMGGEGINVDELPAFVTTVANGVQEENRLMRQEGYVYF